MIINGDPKATGTTSKGRMLDESIVKGLNDGLKKLDNSRYDKEMLINMVISGRLSEVKVTMLKRKLMEMLKKN